ncbi:MAG: T9SS type A sorting domain-containing protein, partial [Bacteroidota bacterium]
DSLGVNWLEGSYDGNTQGTYPIEGELILISGIANPDDLMAEVNVIVDEPSSITDNSHKNVKIFPTPASNLVNVEAQHMIKDIMLIDITGRTLMTKNINSKSSKINVSSLPDGYYMLNITTNKDNYTVKLIVN